MATSPCPPGFYALRNGSGSDCAECPVWYGPGAYDGMPEWGVCSCYPQGTMRHGVCEVASPFAGGGGAVAGGDEPIPAWLEGMNCTYRECQETGCYLARAFPRACAACPSGKRSVGGMWCEGCSGFKQPTPARDECVCIPPSTPDWHGGCVCPAGHESDGTPGAMRCTPCEAGDYQAEDGPVLAGVHRGCARCPSGSESRAGASGCTACEAGKYKEEGMQGCAGCASPTAYATDARSAGSCRECSPACGPGQRWTPCPGVEGWFACIPCEPALRGAQEFVPGDDNRECWWQCASGHYESGGGCARCSTEACPPGRRFAACTAYADRDCSGECVNATMPSENAVWTRDCGWECAAGFILRKTVVVAWVEYTCVD